LLQDIRVIAVDRLIDRPPTPTAAVGKPPAPDIETPPKTMTLEVTERDAQRLLLAAQVGKVDLSLRSLARAREPPVAAWGLDSAVYASDISPLRAAPAAMSGAGFGPSGAGSALPSAAPASQPPVARGLASIHILRGTKEGP
jgi:pilus assembly protein CpaB